MKRNKKKGCVYEIKTSPTITHPERVYICSPLGAETEAEMFCNMRAAGGYAGYVIREMQYFATAVHAYLPFFYNDKVQKQRDEAMKMGLQVLSDSQILMVCGNRISKGMREEIKYAIKKHKEIVVFNQNVFDEVVELVRESGEKEFNIQFNSNHPTLAKAPNCENGDEVRKLCCGFGGA